MERSTDRTISRRTGLLGLGAVGALGVAGGAGVLTSQFGSGKSTAEASEPTPSTSPSPGPAPEPRVEDLATGEDAVVSAALATAWLKPGQDRGWTDEPVTAEDARPDQWLSRMDWAQQQWLLGKTDTQAAMGSRVTVRELSGDWAQVSFADQDAPNDYGLQTSWVPRAHLVRDAGYLSALDAERDVVRVTSDQATVFADRSLKDAVALLPFGTRLPLVEAGQKTTSVMLPGREAGWISTGSVAQGEPERGTAEDVIATAKSFHGRPYLWAGMSPFGFDCSGFTYTVLRANGILVPRDAGPQLNHSGLPKVPADDLTPGDLLFYSHVPGGSRIRHVALYLGKGMGIHSPAVGRKVEVQHLSVINAKRDYAGAVRPQYAQA